MNRNSIVATFAKNLESVNNAAAAVTTPIKNLAANITNALKTNTIVANVNKSFNNSFETNNSAVGTSGANVMNALNVRNVLNHTWFLVIGAVIAVIAGVYLVKLYLTNENPALIQSWLDMFRSKQTQTSGTADLSQPPPLMPPQPPAAVHPDTEAWCFVGEDLTGRYCVKVPSAKSCDNDRKFASRQDCEMVSAQHLPAGVITKQGAGMISLLSGN